VTRAAVILCGGASRRMGADKAWLTIEGVPLLSHVIAAIRSACDRMVVVAAPGQPLPPHAGAERVDDPPERAGLGPLAAVATGLAAARAEVVFLGACDTPALGAEHLELLFARLAREPPEVEAVVPADDDDPACMHPLLGAVRTAPARSAAIERLEAGERSVRALYRALTLRTIATATLPDPQVALPCNTIEQWQRAIEHLRARPPQ